ncbi:hypothetical protein [Methylomagnum ishizawai]|uniref:hypothetical protein n=1 Tax=Methylomagnum ishizawai TaxID=1760988 RepID=UPI001C341F8F|nr:hypothetical protein [Methylomagnum ishizawai]BBL74501.1 hypothetical protein MishRS11D_15990 [Methylomagnum ishizawai]
MWRIEFCSAEFLPVLPEQCQANPGAYGFELAWWLAQALARNGFVTSYPIGEDWGWLIEYISPSGVEFTIGCGSMGEPGAGYLQTPLEWSIFIRPHPSLRQQLKGISHAAEVSRLGRAIVDMLDSKGIVATQAEM